MYETDNFTHIIKVMRDRDEQQRRFYEAQLEFDEAQERSRPWCWAIGLVLLFFVIFVCAYNTP